jgi:hypothetical protein
MYLFVSRWRLNDLEGGPVSTLNIFNKSLDPDRGLRLGKAGAAGRVE